LDSNYAGRVAVITGAASGIGQALAVRLAAEGARLALLDADGPALEGTAQQCQEAWARTRADAAAVTDREGQEAGPRVRADKVDVTDQDAVARCAAAVAGEFGRVDLLVCAAGVIHTGTVEKSSWKDTRRVVEVNLLGAMGTVDAFLPSVRASDAGHVVLFSSGFGLVPMPHYAAYSASKAGVRGFAGALAPELGTGDRPVKVTCVIPGIVRTPIVERGTFGEGEDPAARAASFDQRARTEPGDAAEIVLSGIRQGKAEVLVGPDARAAFFAERALGTAAQRLIPLITRPSRDS
jgi:short-subunit dehydrogenase